jgi:hypothetical protein
MWCGNPFTRGGLACKPDRLLFFSDLSPAENLIKLFERFTRAGLFWFDSPPKNLFRR